MVFKWAEAQFSRAVSPNESWASGRFLFTRAWDECMVDQIYTLFVG